MIKHNHQNKARPFDNKVQGAAPFHQDKMPYEPRETMESKEIKIKKDLNDASMQIRNYKINNKEENLFWIIG